jgi:branched-chain amino acid transport system ATP-binding protein
MENIYPIIENILQPHIGIAHVPEGRQVFLNLTVLENLEMGAWTESGRHDWDANKDYIFDLFPMLKEHEHRFAGAVSGGQQQMLAIGRALASSPSLIMLDESSMGLAPTVADTIFERIVEMRQQRGLTILHVEQRAVEALQNCDHGYVLETGHVVLEGSQQTLFANDRVRQAYLGI